jgi:hypothetical protein
MRVEVRRALKPLAVPVERRAEELRAAAGRAEPAARAGALELRAAAAKPEPAARRELGALSG